MARGRNFSHVRPFDERAVSDLDRSMHRSLWALVTHSSFIEGSHTTKNTASGTETEWSRVVGDLTHKPKHKIEGLNRATGMRREKWQKKFSRFAQKH